MITRNFHLREGRDPGPPEPAPSASAGPLGRLGAWIRRLAQREQPVIKKVAPVAEADGSPTALTNRSA